MGATFRQEGCAIDYTPTTAKTAGDVVVQNGLLGVVKTDIAANALGSLTTEGVFRFTKATSAGNAMAVGQMVYYDTVNDRVTTDPALGLAAGKVVAAAALSDTTVDVTINETDGSAQVAGVAVAASTALTASSTETNFSNSELTLALNTLREGDVIRLRAQGIATATNAADTLTVKIKLGSTVVATTGAIDAVNNDIFYLEADIVVRTTGSSGTIVACGHQILGAEGTVTSKPFKLASTSVNTTATIVAAISGQWSTTSGSNSCRLDVCNWEILHRN
jgi:predicted RecA/RadA family phage recombinase